MPSRNSLSWKALKKSLRKLLKGYREIDDIIVFGSSVKDKFQPKDIDLAVITYKRELSLIGELSSKLPESADIENLLPTQIYQTKLGLSIISEGFSIRQDKFLRDILGIEPKKAYSYDLTKLTHSKKRSFNRALKEQLKETKGTRLGAGCVMIPLEKTGSFEEFLEYWNLNFESRKYNLW